MADYINREELIKNLKKFAPEHYSALVNTLIEKQPAADVVSIGVLQQVMWERDIAISQLESYGVGFAEEADITKVKHGKWVCGGNIVDKYCYCSECNEDALYDKGGMRKLSNFCPHCGAKMDGGVDDE